MEKTLDTSIELARYFDNNGNKKTVTIADYNSYVDRQERDLIAEFIFRRLQSRYLKPFQFEDQKYTQQFKNGFSIMANCCLLIETLQSFKNGWEDSQGKSMEAFTQFLSTETKFAKVFKSKKQKEGFYKNIRCGILHQGETTGGWTINRNRKGKNLFDNSTFEVNSIVFAIELEASLKNYSEKLKTEKWDSETWDNFRTKMRKIISNCER
ncbi:MAG: hypothetical protein ACK481_09965 [Candidatus Melainabacteria bacterium]|jgi:hypothetical protein